MYDFYIYASYLATFVPLTVLVALSFHQLKKARAHIAALEAAPDSRATG